MRHLTRIFCLCLGFLAGYGVGSILCPPESQPVPVIELRDAPRPVHVAPAERGEGVGVLPEVTPVFGEPLRNAARAAEIERRAHQYRRDYEQYGIDGK